MTTANSETPAGNPKRKRWLLILLAVIVLATLASVAWEFFYGRWHEDNRWHGNARWNGYTYRAPPVVYGTPDNYGYYSAPLVYDNAAGFSITIRP